MHIEEYWNIHENSNPIAFNASSDPGIMYLHEAMQQKDRKEFVDAMEKEVNDQMVNENWMIVHKSKIPKGKVIFQLFGRYVENAI